MNKNDALNFMNSLLLGASLPDTIFEEGGIIINPSHVMQVLEAGKIPDDMHPDDAQQVIAALKMFCEATSVICPIINGLN